MIHNILFTDMTKKKLSKKPENISTNIVKNEEINLSKKYWTETFTENYKILFVSFFILYKYQFFFQFKKTNYCIVFSSST